MFLQSTCEISFNMLNDFKLFINNKTNLKSSLFFLLISGGANISAPVLLFEILLLKARSTFSVQINDQKHCVLNLKQKNVIAYDILK